MTKTIRELLQEYMKDNELETMEIKNMVDFTQTWGGTNFDIDEVEYPDEIVYPVEFGSTIKINGQDRWVGVTMDRNYRSEIGDEEYTLDQVVEMFEKWEEETKNYKLALGVK